MSTPGMPKRKRRHTCYPHEFTSIHDASVKQYDFAEEREDIETFLLDYENLPNDLIVKGSLNTSAVPCQMHEELCNECKASANGIYDNCLLTKTTFQLENCIRFSLSFHPQKTHLRCPKCGTYSGVSGSSRESVVEVRDVRLENMPAKLLIFRSRPMCSNEHCRNLLGEQRIVGLESYAAGGMTLRLTASVLACHLNGIKRSYIAEAYAISNSQIDRIKKRVVDMMELASAVDDVQHIFFECLLIERKRFNITDSQGSPIELFFDRCDSSGELKLASAYKSTTMDEFRCFLQEKNPEYLYPFRSREEFIRTGVDYYVGYCGTSGQRLREHIVALEMYYIVMFERNGADISPDELGNALNDLFDAMEDGKHGLKTKLNRIYRLSKHLEQSSGLYEWLTSVSFRVQMDFINSKERTYYDLTKEEVQEDLRLRNKAMSDAATLVQRCAQKSVLAGDKLIERLLYYNPAVIPPQVMDLFGTTAGDVSLAENDYGEYMSSVRYGLPLACLTHLLKEGLLEDRELPLHCHLTGSDGACRPNCDLYPLMCPHWTP